MKTTQLSWLCFTTACIVVLQLALSPAIYFGVLNAIGPSTEYFDPSIIGATFDDGKYYAYLGDKIYVSYTVLRHKVNGSCLLNVWRYGEDVGGLTPGRRHLLSYADLQFVGKNEILRPHWPLAGLVLGYDVDTDDKPDLDRPLLHPGVEVQELDLYVVARYHCNFLDELFPRYLQGGPRPNETERVRLVVTRTRP